MKRILLTGADGMLGSDISAQLLKVSDISLIKTTINDLDITNGEEVLKKVAAANPDIIIHTAAFTAVDLAEKEKEKCFLINTQGTRNITDCAKELNAQLIFISTDYVFDGKKDSPYIESDRRNPINVYGKSKSDAEEIIENTLSKYKIVRTSWLNGLNLKYTGNFIEAIIKKATTEKKLRIINDQIGKPTFTFDLASKIIEITDNQEYGIYHITNDEVSSWYDFANTILEEKKIKNVEVFPIKSSEYHSLAERPKNSVLENKKLFDLNISILRSWKLALKEYFRKKEEVKNE